MLFNSFDFLVFFPTVVLGYFLLPHRFQWAWLLLASCLFYMAFIPAYILILFVTITVDYFAGLLIEPSLGFRRKTFLGASIFINVGMLAVFKYYNFFAINWNALCLWSHFNSSLPVLAIILPIGLSFHTFQAMSYTIEVYRGAQKAEKHFGRYALYVMFFPQLVAGPIERPGHLLRQIQEKRHFTWDNLFSGAEHILWGLFKKVVVADRLAGMVDTVYNSPEGWSGFPLMLATVLFAVQIYCDFSGYSEIAVGTARILGFNLMVNFRQPYFSKSISEFWRRWHISLMSWFKDYVYIPLGGNRVPVPRWCLNVAIVFLLSGFWHGAHWTFVIWGLLNGAFCISEMLAAKTFKFPRLPSVLKVFLTFGLVNITWIFFRASSLHDATYILTHLLTRDESGAFFALAHPDPHGLPSTYLGLAHWKFLCSVCLVPFLFFAEWLIANGAVARLKRAPVWVSWPVYYATAFAIIVFGVFETHQFIYFQF
ncbi:MAG: MBOAT family protein [Verrucomicrobia bacterium]|nr:MBOAT family protein [Verrucomicrobiota bacterium]